MNQNGQTEKKYSSFEEFKRAFYPQTTKADDLQRSDESYGREMARYTVERHFPARDETGQSK